MNCTFVPGRKYTQAQVAELDPALHKKLAKIFWLGPGEWEARRLTEAADQLFGAADHCDGALLNAAAA